MSFPIKIAFNGELRRFMSAAPSFVEIVAAVHQMFPRLAGGFSLKYEDEENELITIASDAELMEAMAICEQLHRKTLKLIVVSSRDEEWVSVSDERELEPVKEEPKEEEPKKEEPKKEEPKKEEPKKEEPKKEDPKPQEELKEEPKEASCKEQLLAALRALATDEATQAELPRLAEVALSDVSLDALSNPNLPLVDLLRNIATPHIAAHPLFGRLLAWLAQANVTECWARVREHLLGFIPLVRAMRPTILMAIPALMAELPAILQSLADKLAGKFDEEECPLAQFLPLFGGFGAFPFMAAFMGQGAHDDDEHVHENENENVAKQENGATTHRGITCDGCGVSPIVGLRFKCTVCRDFDLCATCEAKGEHAPAHPLLQFRNPAENAESVHHNIVCDGCGVSPIKGARFKCTTCNNFDLCDECEQKTEHPHPMLKMRRPAPCSFRRGGPQFRGRRFGPGFGRPCHPFGPGAHHPFGPGAHHPFGPGPHAFRHGAFPLGPLLHRMFWAGHRGFQRDMRSPNNSASSVFMQDVTLPDGAEVVVGADVLKTWKIRNDGQVAWPEGTTLALKKWRGAKFSATAQPLGKLAAPGEEVEVSAVLRALEPGRAMIRFRLADASGQPFGAKLWADVIAKPAEKREEPPKAEEPRAEPEMKKEEPAPAPVVEPAPAPVVEPAPAPVVEPTPTPKPKRGVHDEALETLASMGFNNTEFNLLLLAQEKGNVARVVARLVS